MFTVISWKWENVAFEFLLIFLKVVQLKSNHNTSSYEVYRQIEVKIKLCDEQPHINDEKLE